MVHAAAGLFIIFLQQIINKYR